MGLTLNQVIIAGNLTRDPEMRQLGEGKVVVNFAIANNRRRKNPDGTVSDEATFIECESWARTAEMVGQYLTKGSPCIVVGRLKQENWVDKESGGKRSRLKLVVENVQFVGSRRPDGGEGGESGSIAESDAAEPAAVDHTRPQQRPQRVITRATSHGHKPADQRSGSATLLDEPPF